MELDHGTTERRRIIVSGVVVEVEGDSEVLRDFTDALIEDGVILGPDLIAAAHDDLEAGRDRAEIAAAFHEGVANVAARACAELPEPHVNVVLSGGTFQNVRLLRSVRRELASLGFGVLTHRSVPPNDGGISFGQAAIAARRVD